MTKQSKFLFGLSYKVLRFDQFPMKSGILPVRLVSDAHLQKYRMCYLNLDDQYIIVSVGLIMRKISVFTKLLSFADLQMLKESGHWPRSYQYNCQINKGKEYYESEWASQTSVTNC